jgi:hypothetical protein
MEHYYTLFDSLFLPQGLTLFHSLEKFAGSFKLWVVCVDDKAFEVLKKLNLPNLEPIHVIEVENEHLLKVKAQRSAGEYCWSLTPFIPDYIFSLNDEISRLTYLDADMWLLNDPSPIFLEYEDSGKAILITEHAYAPQYDYSNIYGRFCVQLLVFKRGESSEVLKWWGEQCIESCSSVPTEGGFGDQKYLDQWPILFANKVHILSKPQYMQAPWNSIYYPHSQAIFYHFHGLRILNRKQCSRNAFYFIPEVVMQFLYAPYLASLKYSMECSENMGIKQRPQKKIDNLYGIKSKLVAKIPFLRNQYISPFIQW